MGALYKTRLYDNSGKLLAVLENSTGEREHRRFNQAGDIQLSLLASDPKAKFLALATRFEIWRRGQRISSGTITRRDVSGDPWTLFGLTNETLLAGIQTPGNVEINGGVSLLSDSADLAHIFEALTYDYKVLSLNRSFDTSYVAGLTDTGTISFELEDQVALKLDAENTYPAVNLGDTAGCVCFQFSIPEGYELFRLRWQQQVAETNQIVFRYRTSVNGGNSWTVWSSWIGHGDSQETSAAQGYPLVHPVGTDTVQIQFQLTNADTETVTEGYDDAGEEIVIYGTTPILEAVELVCRQEAALRAVTPHDTDWPQTATVTVTDVQLHYHNCLQAMVEVAEKFGYEFFVDDDCKLHLGKQLGVDRSSEIIFRAGRNMNIVQLEDSRHEMCNILTCLGAGDSLHQLRTVVVNSESVAEYGPHPDKMEWKDIETLEELEAKGREIVGTNLADPGERGAPKQTFRIQGVVHGDLPPFYLGDMVRIIIPKDGVNTTGRILEVVRGPSERGDTVDIMINRTRESAVDRIVQAIERIPTPKPAESKKPAPPSNVRATGGYRRIVVQWQARADVLSRVYHSVTKDGPYRIAYQGPDRKWIHEPLEVGETHHYKVSVVVDGVESDMVGPVKATVPGVPRGDLDQTPPGNVAWDTCEFLREIILRWFPTALAAEYEIRSVDDDWGETEGCVWRGNATTITLRPTQRTHTYYIRAISAAGVYSLEATRITLTNATPGTPPPPEVMEFFSALRIAIRPVSDDDIESYTLYMTPCDAQGDPVGETLAIPVGFAPVTYQASPGCRFRIEVAARDVLGEGGKSTPVYAHTRKIEGVAEFAQGLTPPRIVDELPTLPDEDYPEGCLVVLTTDHVLYRCTGGGWDASVNVEQIVGKIKAGMIEAGAIGADEIAAGEILADHFAAGSIEAYIAAIQEAFIDSAKIISVEADKITVGGSAPGIPLTKPAGARLWHFDGSLVSTDGISPESGAVATLRPNEGMFGGCAAVEVGTTNLLNNPGWLSGDLTSWTNYAVDGATGTHEVVPDTRFTCALKLTKTDAGAGRVGVSQSLAKPFSTTVVSDGFYLRVLGASAGATVVLHSDYRLSDDTWAYGRQARVSLSSMGVTGVYGTAKIDSVGDGWYWVRFSSVPSSPATVGGPTYLWIEGNAAEVLIAHNQKEALPFPTSFATGTRAAGTLSYDVLPGIEAGTVAFRARYNKTAYEYVPHPYFISGGYSGSDWPGGVSVFSLNRLYWDIRNASGTPAILGVPDNLIAGLSDGEWFFAGLAWQHTGTNQWTYRLAVGSRLGFGSVEQVTDIVPADLTTLHLGSSGGLGSTISGTWFDELLVCPFAATPEQMAAWHNMGAPFVDPEGIVDADSTPVYAANRTHVITRDGATQYDDQGNRRVHTGYLGGLPWGNTVLPVGTYGQWGDGAGLYLRGYARLITAGFAEDEDVIDLSGYANLANPQVLVAPKELVSYSPERATLSHLFVDALKLVNGNYRVKAKTLVKGQNYSWGGVGGTRYYWEFVRPTESIDGKKGVYTDFFICRPGWWVSSAGVGMYSARLWMDITDQFDANGDPINWVNIRYFSQSTGGSGTLNWDTSLPHYGQWALRVRGEGGGSVLVEYASTSLTASGYRSGDTYLDVSGDPITDPDPANVPSGMSVLYMVFDLG